MAKVVYPGFTSNNAAALADRVRDLLSEYAGKLLLAEALGVLEIVKHNMIEEHNNG